jgi:hypothetical protein
MWLLRPHAIACVIVQIQPVLEIMEEVMMGLPRALDGRVYVAVGRGLWDLTAKEIYDYVEGLQEGKENKVSVSLIIKCLRPSFLLPLDVLNVLM